MTTPWPLVTKPRRHAALPSRDTALPEHHPALEATTRPTVRQILGEWGPWVCCMGLLGLCDDGIPLAARFYDWERISHFVFYGQDDKILATLLEPLLYSVIVQRHGVARWQFIILSEASTEWQVAESPYCKARISPHQRGGDDVIPQMAGLMEQRLLGRHRGPRYLVVLHDLGNYWQHLHEDARYDLLPLLQRGPEVGINVLVTLRYEHYTVLPAEIRRLLRHKVYGYAENAHLPNTSALRDVANLLYYDLTPWQAWTRSGGQWVRYTAPRLG